MKHLNTSSGVARRALTAGTTPAEYGAEMVEAFETFAWLDRRGGFGCPPYGRPRRPLPRRAAAQLLVQQYHHARQVEDDDVAQFLSDALVSIVGVIGAHVVITYGRLSGGAL